MGLRWLLTVVGIEDRVHVNGSCERFGGLAGVGVGFMGAADELHGGWLC